jgi:hypothetical protein
MDATSIIAIYAALVASAALGVQFAQWRSARTSLKVEANAGVAPVQSGDHDGYGNETSESGEVVFLRLTNRSPHAIKIVHVGMQIADRKDKRALAFAHPYPLHIQLPFEIPPRDNITLWQPRHGLKEWESQRLGERPSDPTKRQAWIAALARSSTTDSETESRI